MKQIVSNYTYSPTANCVTLTGVNIDADQLLLIVAPEAGRTLYNFASVTGSVVPGASTRVNLTASTAGLTASSPLVIYYDDQASATSVTGTVALDPASLIALENVTVTIGSSVTVGGTVTANVFGLNAGGVQTAIPVQNGNEGNLAFSGIPIAWNDNDAPDTRIAGTSYPLPIQGTVTANVYSGQYIKVTFTGEFNGTYYLERKEEYLWQSGTGGLDFGEMTIGWNDNLSRWDFNLGGEGLQATNGNATYLPPKNGWGDFDGLDSLTISYENPLATQVFGTVTVGNSITIGSCVTHGVTVANSVTIASLPAISGTVTIGNFPSTQTIQGTVTANTGLSQPLTDAQLRASAVPVSLTSLPASTVTARLQDSTGIGLTSTTIGSTPRLNVTLASAITTGGSLPAVINVYGGSDSGTVRAVAVDSSGRTVVTVSNFPASQTVAGTVTANISGTVPVSGTFWQATQPVSLTSTTVTVSALPSGALTTRFGSVTTANLATLTAAVTNTSRKYLLAQNISAGTVTIGIGFSPTTTQGIQLTAGGGLSFDAFCPTGAVYWLGSVTGAAFTILEG